MSTFQNQSLLSTTNINKLLTEFSSSIDSSLIYAISSDYPETEEGYRSTREILIRLSNQIQSEENSIEETNIGLDLSQVELDEIDKELDVWDIEQTQIDLASSKADFESDELTTTSTIDQDGSNHNLNSDEHQDLSTSDNSPISLLKCMFPSLTIDVLKSALGSDSSSIDLSLAVDRLLLPNHSILFESSHSSNLLDPIKSPTKKNSSKRKNQNKKGLQTIHLTDVMRGDERERINEAKKKAKEDGPSSIPENKWITLASQTEFLSDLLKIDSSKIKTGYIRHHCNLVLTIEEILNKLVLERQLKEANEEELIRFTTNLKNLKQLLPNQDDVLLNKLLIVTLNDPNSAFDLIRFLDELFISEGTTIWNIFHRIPINQTIIETKSNESDHPSGFQQVSLSKNSNQKIPTDSVNRFSESICISKASHYRNLRDHAFRQAGQAYQTSRSIPTRRGGALVYAEEGRKFDLKAKYWELEAGKAKVRERSFLDAGPGAAAGMTRSIDLHGLSRIQALAVTRDFLNRWESSSKF